MTTFDTNPLGRRKVLGLAGAGLAGAGVAGIPIGAHAETRLRADLFRVGVASGDPLPDGVVLWTRLAPDPVAADGSSGMPPRQVEVEWEIAKSPKFEPKTIVGHGTSVARPELHWSVHVEVGGLQPDRPYWYRFRADRQISPVGRTRTAPARGARLASLTFAFTSCQAYNAGYFTALRYLAADEELAVAFHLGDYIYEGGSAGSIGRPHLPAAETFSLTDYRIRYGQYKTDPDLQAAHAALPWIVVPDDHEVENNWAGDRSQPDNEPDQDPAVFLQRRAAAFQAYYENQPLRRASMPNGPDMRLYRRFGYADLASFHVLDTRQYRSPAPLENNNEVRWDPERTMLGDEQEAWLIDGMTRSSAAWNIVANQSKVAETDDTIGEGESYPAENWDGYAAPRARLFDAVHERNIDNMVIITGDAHVNLAADLKPRFKDDSSPIVGAEFLGTSITSGGDGADVTQRGLNRLAENPHLKFYNSQRGYQRCVMTPDALRVEFRVMPYVTAPDAPISTRAVGHVEAGRPGIAQLENGATSV